MDSGIEIKVERIHRLETDSSLKGFADISISGCFIVKGLRIVSGKNGLFVGMPQQLGKDGKWHNRVSLVDEAAKVKLSDLILSAYDN